MKRKLFSVAFLMGIWSSYSQVGIGTQFPNKSTQLEVVAKNKGILIPQVPLKSITDSTTISNGNVTSLLIFNTATTNEITPGYYYWNEDKWLRIVDDTYLKKIDTNTKNVSLTLIDDSLVLTDSDGDSIFVSMASLVAANETLTILNYDKDTNQLTYQDEAGTIHTLDLAALVSSNETLTILNYNESLNQLT